MKFFLYGDHLNPTQLKRRAPEHQFLMLGTLPEHTIKFCRWSLPMAMRPRQRDSVTGRTGLGSDLRSDRRRSQADGPLRRGCTPKRVSPGSSHRADRSRGKIPVITYAATPIGKFKPKAHYLDWVMKGLKHWKLPEEAIETWKSYVPQ